MILKKQMIIGKIYEVTDFDYWPKYPCLARYAGTTSSGMSACYNNQGDHKIGWLQWREVQPSGYTND